MIEVGSDHLAQVAGLLRSQAAKQSRAKVTPPPPRQTMCPESSWPNSNLWGQVWGWSDWGVLSTRAPRGAGAGEEGGAIQSHLPKPTSAHWGLVWAQQELSLTGDTAVGDGVGWGREWWMGVWGRWEELPRTGKSSSDASLAFSGNNLLLLYLSWFMSMLFLACWLATGYMQWITNSLPTRPLFDIPAQRCTHPYFVSATDAQHHKVGFEQIHLCGSGGFGHG